MRQTESGSEIQRSGFRQAFRIAKLPTDEDKGFAILEYEIRISVTDIGQRTHEFIPESDLDCRAAGDRKTVLCEAVGVPLTKLHLRDAGLALLHCRQPE